jgi:hypothetical protein
MKTINVRSIWDVSSEVSSSGHATVSIWTDKHKLILHLGIDEVNYLANDLWEITRKRKALIAENEKVLRGEWP